MNQNTTTTTNDTENEKIAGQINNMHMMDARRHTLFGWLVTDWRGDHNAGYFVNLNERTCECQAFDSDEVEHGVCDHILLANHVASDSSTEAAMQYDLQRQLTQLRDIADRLDRKATGLSADVTHAESAQDAAEADAVSDGSSGASNNDESAESGVVEVEPTSEQQALVDDVQSWLVESAGVVGFDPQIIQTDWVETPDGPGVRVEASPFQAGYWDDGEWQDQEGFEDQKETLKDSVLKARDEVVWFGEPDYANVVLEADVEDVIN